jgi:hypothetical protein
MSITIPDTHTTFLIRFLRFFIMIGRMEGLLQHKKITDGKILVYALECL